MVENFSTRGYLRGMKSKHGLIGAGIGALLAPVIRAFLQKQRGY